ncbi:transcription factor FER-LIKE IRON DEFICIENCY-INDUCED TRANSCRIPTION FACTOR [Alnus glutinosa]|uniref:transcription factor FER-LIKE IRON DEFICIENCY-INDUCED TRANSCRIPTION FACTOR n=1 Tax=Alnus glutinosa TaxID=3517 RepID=UPI002D76E23E|nr:transcription factor FER-LIKE IRON DEFICIENCY-INDUCED TRANSCRIPTION FACTOR [Alnus glutinosa]
MDASGNNLAHMNDFELHDFVDESNFIHCINLIRGEGEDPVVNYGTDDLVNGCFVDAQFDPIPIPIPEDIYSFNATTMVSDPNSVFNSLPSFGGEEEDIDGEDSSATTTTTTTTNTTPTKKEKVDRSRTLISERRRRGRMKEKLYALRSLVPNITKMDKASIVGDALLYVQELQTKAKKLKAEIAGLEASLLGSERYHQAAGGSTDDQSPKKIQLLQNEQYSICKNVIQMDVFQVEERGFYVRLVCEKGVGVALSLYKALESLTGFIVQSSNLATVSERFVLTFTLNVRDCEREMNLPNLKLWVAGALLNQGFEFTTPLSA